MSLNESSTEEDYDLVPARFTDYITHKTWLAWPLSVRKNFIEMIKDINSFFMVQRPFDQPVFGFDLSPIEKSQFKQRFEYFINNFGRVFNLFGYFAIPFRNRTGSIFFEYYKKQIFKKKILDPSIEISNNDIVCKELSLSQEQKEKIDIDAMEAIETLIKEYLIASHPRDFEILPDRTISFNDEKTNQNDDAHIENSTSEQEYTDKKANSEQETEINQNGKENNDHVSDDKEEYEQSEEISEKENQNNEEKNTNEKQNSSDNVSNDQNDEYGNSSSYSSNEDSNKESQPNGTNNQPSLKETITSKSNDKYPNNLNNDNILVAVKQENNQKPQIRSQIVTQTPKVTRIIKVKSNEQSIKEPADSSFQKSVSINEILLDEQKNKSNTIQSVVHTKNPNPHSVPKTIVVSNVNKKVITTIPFNKVQDSQQNKQNQQNMHSSNLSKPNQSNSNNTPHSIKHVQTITHKPVQSMQPAQSVQHVKYVKTFQQHNESLQNQQSKPPAMAQVIKHTNSQTTQPQQNIQSKQFNQIPQVTQMPQYQQMQQYQQLQQMQQIPYSQVQQMQQYSVYNKNSSIMPPQQMNNIWQLQPVNQVWNPMPPVQQMQQIQPIGIVNQIQQQPSPQSNYTYDRQTKKEKKKRSKKKSDDYSDAFYDEEERHSSAPLHNHNTRSQMTMEDRIKSFIGNIGQSMMLYDENDTDRDSIRLVRKNPSPFINLEFYNTSDDE